MKWVRQLKDRISELGADAESRWDLRFVPLVDNADPAVADYVRQVATGAPWDVVMVDGWSRLKCLLAGLHEVKSGGVLVLDNANQKQFVDVPNVMRSWQRLPLRGLGVARSWVTQTDVYIRSAEPDQSSAQRE